MPLKTFVKVGNISNLSDARYCAGMGVDMLGFRVIPGNEHYVPAKVFQEIRGWVTGPRIVAELYGIDNPDVIPAIVEQYAPDYFELSADEYERFRGSLKLPILVRNGGNLSSTDVHFVIGESPTPAASGKFLLEPSSVAQMMEAITSGVVAGISLKGTPEERPGFKDYSTLSEVLELLDEY